jgi:hypothetical protein
MPSTITRLAALAEAVHGETISLANHSHGSLLYGPIFDDPVLEGGMGTANLIGLALRSHPDAASLINDDPDFEAIRDVPDQLGPLLQSPASGVRVTAQNLISGVLASAALQIYYFNLPSDPATFVRTAIDGFEELRRAVRGEQVRVYGLHGVAYLSLPLGVQATTPWGTLRSAPKPPPSRQAVFRRQVNATCTLTSTYLAPILFDRSPSPPAYPRPYAVSSPEYLFPLACGLASTDPEEPIVPLLTWSTTFLPFYSHSAFSVPPLPTVNRATKEIAATVQSIEEWSRIVSREHRASIDISARRLVSAVSHRGDYADSLIDAVMVWENLLGTSSEVTYRVTAALAKLLAASSAERQALRKELAKIYSVRSRLVHGASIEQEELKHASRAAISHAVQALRASYLRGDVWLSMSSTDRSDQLILGMP